jgi:hypothetical protein
MIKAVLMGIVIISAIGVLIFQIPDLAIGFADLIDSVFTTELTTLLNNAYDSIPVELMNLLVIGISVLVITIIISHVTGGKK